MTGRPLLVGALVLAFAWPAHAAADLDEEDLPLPPMPAAPSGPPPGARKITDGALTCAQIQAESRSLEQAALQHRVEADTAQREANTSQQDMMKQAGGGMSAMPLASSLLGMLPGGSLVSSMAAEAAMSAQRSAMQDGAARMMASYQRIAQAQEQLAYAQARNDHLVGLFLAKKCKLAEEPAKP